MKKIVAAAIATLALASLAMAADTVVFPAMNGNVTFNHTAHQAITGCKTCHGEGTPAKIVMNKDKGHTLCRDCHQQQKNGKVSGRCGECHKR